MTSEKQKSCKTGVLQPHLVNSTYRKGGGFSLRTETSPKVRTDSRGREINSTSSTKELQRFVAPLAILKHSWKLHFQFNISQLGGLWTLPGPRGKTCKQNLRSPSCVLRAQKIHTLSQCSLILTTCLVVNQSLWRPNF